jgi:hypothetical protein
MENKLDILTARVDKLENIVTGMSHTISEKINVDLVEETKENLDGEKETNNETNDSSGKQSNKGTRKSKK